MKFIYQKETEEVVFTFCLIRYGTQICFGVLCRVTKILQSCKMYTFHINTQKMSHTGKYFYNFTPGLSYQRYQRINIISMITLDFFITPARK